MAHEYSVLIHDWISEKINRTKQELKPYKNIPDTPPAEQKSFLMGQLEELNNIRKYLTDQFDLNTQKYYQK